MSVISSYHKRPSMWIYTTVVYFLTLWLDCFSFGLWNLENYFVDGTIYSYFYYSVSTCSETESGLQQKRSSSWMLVRFLDTPVLCCVRLSSIHLFKLTFLHSVSFIYIMISHCQSFVSLNLVTTTFLLNFLHWYCKNTICKFDNSRGYFKNWGQHLEDTKKGTTKKLKRAPQIGLPPMFIASLQLFWKNKFLKKKSPWVQHLEVGLSFSLK